MFRLSSFLLFFFASFSSLFAKIEINFIVDKYYLIAHTLSCNNSRSFSSQKHKEDILAFQNEVWKNNEESYRLLPNEMTMTIDLYHHKNLQPCYAMG